MPGLVISYGLWVQRKKNRSPNSELRTPNHKGFTLVELLIAILIILVISVLAIPNIKKFSQDQEIEDASNSVINVLRLAQSNAMSSIKCSGSLASSNWVAEFQKTTFRLYAKCTDDSKITLISSTNYVKNRAGLVEVVDFGDFGVSCLNPPQTLSVRFTGSAIDGFCDTNPVDPTNPIVPSSPINIKLRNTEKTTSQKTIVINKGGVINKQ